jgi:DNA-binding MarR family transcriptional regulator
MADIDPESLDDIIHGRMRLGIMAYLSAVDSTTFVVLRKHLNATGGNLSVALTKLSAAGYVDISRTIKARKTETTIRITDQGRVAWSSYLDQMKRLLGL